MGPKNIGYIALGTGLILLIAVGMIFLLPARPVRAQCGSQASSCKNCHETQAKDPVNNDGTAWHTQHAFGDFCYLCHAGNNQATDETAAHAGMVSPLADIDASCKSCHSNDTLKFAQTYATTLGVTLGTGGSSSATPAPVATQAPVGNAAPAATQAAIVPAGDLVDYSQRYNVNALGAKPTNVGDMILLVILGVLLFGGGFFVLQREGFLKISFEDPKRVAVNKTYPADVVEMLPEISQLKPDSRKALQNILAKPKVAADLFTSIDRFTQEETIELEASVEADSTETDSTESIE